jgi:hypothetical protein
MTLKRHAMALSMQIALNVNFSGKISMITELGKMAERQAERATRR